MPTKLDVVTYAFRKLGIVSNDEALEADDAAYGSDQYDFMIADLASSHDVTIWGGADDVSTGAVIPLGALLAVNLGAHYEIATEPLSRALLRVRAYALPDDRPDSRDTDGNGVISDAEAAAGKRAAYY